MFMHCINKTLTAFNKFYWNDQKWFLVRNVTVVFFFQIYDSYTNLVHNDYTTIIQTNHLFLLFFFISFWTIWYFNFTQYPNSIPTTCHLNWMEWNWCHRRHNKARVPYVHQIFTVNVAFFTVFPSNVCAVAF